MQSTKMLRLQPFMMQSMKMRALPFNRVQAPALRAQQTRTLKIQPTKPLKSPMPKEAQSAANPVIKQTAHTISQRLRTLKKIPPELIPLGVVLAFAIFAASFALFRKLTSDKTLRLWPEKKRHSAPPAEHH